MAKVTALEAKTRLGELLNRVSRGEEIVITRHDKPVARLIPEGRPSLEGVRRAVRDLHDLRGQISRRPRSKRITNKEILAAINEGRP
jgi:prevent-host-death family protein